MNSKSSRWVLAGLSSMSMALIAGCSSSELKRTDDVVQPKMAQGGLFAKEAKEVAKTEQEQIKTSQAAPTAAPEAEASSLKDQLSSLAKTEESESGLRVRLEESFDFNKDQLRPEAADKLTQIAKILSQRPEEKIEIEGYTDSIGTNEINKDLSLRRAQTVKDFLASKGVQAHQMVTTGLGKTNPVASNESEQGRAQNRRAELVIVVIHPAA